MATQGEHAYLPKLRSELRRGKIDRREFLRTAMLLGVSAGTAYAMAGLPMLARAQSELPKGGKIRIGMRVQEIKDPQTISWVEPSNVLRNTVQYPHPHRCQQHHPSGAVGKMGGERGPEDLDADHSPSSEMAIRPAIHVG